MSDAFPDCLLPLPWQAHHLIFALQYASMILIRRHSLEHPELEFSGPSQGDGLAASPGFINAIGGLLPMAPCGRTSL
jgi:hypothetical protein